MTKKPKIKRHIKLSTVFASIMLFLMISALVVTGTGVVYISGVLAAAPTLDPSDFESAQSTKIYDKDGVLIADIGMEKRDLITYSDLPQSTVDAFLAIEDSRFFEHNGFDVPRFIKVSLETVSSGEFGAGGSTLTMQLVKNTYFGSEEQQQAETSIIEKLNRKIQEIYLALEAEQVLSKARILELYLNKINFGVPANKRGIQTASQYYFAKNVQDLNLVESAMLAGIINKPTRYNPMQTLNPDVNYVQESIDRTHTVLYMMLYHGYITQDEYDQAMKVDLMNLVVGSLAATVNTPYQSYVDTVINEVTTLTGQNPVDVPMVIYTNMDRALQDKVEDIQNGNTFKWYEDRIQMGLITIDNQTGAIMAVGGGRNYNGERLFNRATDMFRQPGSTMKSVLSYLLAFEYLGWSTDHIISDEPYSFSMNDPKMIVANVFDKYQGDVTMEYAVGWSLNIPAILTLKQVVSVIGSAAVVEHLNNMGFGDVKLGTGSMSFDLGYAIGGSTLRVSPYQLGGAYSVLFNGGNYIQPHTVSRVEFLDGTAPLVPTYAKTQVVSTDAAFLVTRLLKNNVEGSYFGGYAQLRRPYPVYLKTGTSNWGEEAKVYGIPDGASKDLWMVSGTSEYTTALWVGFDSAIKGQLSYINDAVAKRGYREKISTAVLDTLYATRDKPNDVVKPNGVTQITHVLGVFPYVSPLPNMNPMLITTGWIKKSFANMGVLSVPAVYDPTSVAAIVTPNSGLKHVTVTLNDYPDPLALLLAPNTREMTLTVKNVTINAVGNRAFDYSWVYGPIKYFARISVDGTTVDTITSSSPIIETDLSITPANEVIVCGYFGYETAPNHSAEICQTLDLNNMSITAPTTLTGAKIDDVLSWLSINGLTDYSITYQLPPTTDGTKLGTIASITNLNEGETYTYNQLSNKHFDIVVYDKVIDLYNGFVNKPFVTPSYYDYIPFAKPAEGITITSILIDYNTVDATTPPYMLSELYRLFQISTTRIDFNW